MVLVRVKGRPQAMTELNELLEHLIEQQGSDLHIKARSTPHIRVHGRLQRTAYDPTTPDEVEAIVAELLPVSRSQELVDHGEISIAYGVSGLGRFRVNVYRQRGTYGISIRWVVPGAPPIAELKLPIIEKLASEESGLVLIAGPASSGKSTTAAAMIDHINSTRSVHIVTLEDPIEVLVSDKSAMISQRELGVDTRTFAEAMRRINRLDPDVVFISELRDAATITEVLSVAGAGHLVIATLTTNSATETLHAIVEYFPVEQQDQIRHSLASVLRGIVTQRLMSRGEGRGQVPVAEVLINTTKVFDAIVAGVDAEKITELITGGEYHGMQTHDQALFILVQTEEIEARDAIAFAESPQELRISLQRAGLAADGSSPH